LGDRQSSHPVKTLLQYYGKSLEALPGVAYPGFRDKKKVTICIFISQIGSKHTHTFKQQVHTYNINKH